MHTSCHRRTLAVVVEGEVEVQLLQLSNAGGTYSLNCTQRLALEGVQAPCNAQFDAQGRLWVVGGPPVLQSSSAHVGVARPATAGESPGPAATMDAAAASNQASAADDTAAAAAPASANGASTSSSSSGTLYVDCTAKALTAEGRAALEQRNEEEEQVAGAPVLHYSEHLKKRAYEGETRLGKGRDFKETQRLSKLAEQHAEQQRQQQEQQQQD